MHRSYLRAWRSVFWFLGLLVVAFLSLLVPIPTWLVDPVAIQHIHLFIGLCTPVLVVMVVASAILLAIPNSRAVWRYRHGRCAKCGYRLLPATATCPECGTAVPDT